MADTLPNLKLPADVWVDVYAATGLPVGTPLSLENVGHISFYFTEQADQPAPDHDGYRVVKRHCCTPVGTDSAPLGLWVYSPTEGGKLNASIIDDVADRALLSSFNDILAAERTPIVFASGQNGILPEITRTIESGGATAGVNADGQFEAASGAGAGVSLSSVFSALAAPYRAGQGFVATFNAAFDDNTGRPDHRLGAGPANATDSLQVARIGGVDMVRYTRHGQQEIQTLLFSAGASGTEDVTVTINGTPYPVTLTTGAARQAAQQTAAQLNGAVPAWLFQAVGDAVVARSLLSAPAGGAFTFTPDGTAAASFSQTAAGAVPEDVQYVRDDWTHGDRVPWLNLSNENAYLTVWQQLGSVAFFVQNPSTLGFTLFHVIDYPNSAGRPMFAQPSTRIGFTASDSTGGDALGVRGSEYALFTPGPVLPLTPPRSKTSTEAALVTASFKNVLTVRVSEVFKDKVNVGAVSLDEITSVTAATKGAEVLVVENAEFATPLTFDYFDEENSIVQISGDGSTYTPNSGTVRRTLRVPADYAVAPPVDLRKFAAELQPGNSYSFIMRREAGGSATAGEVTVVGEEVL